MVAALLVRCRYLEVPQVPQTLGVLGSRPWWLWGFEHGTGEPDPSSAWWTLEQLGDLVRDPARLTPIVQGALGAWEAAMLAEAAGDPRGPAARLDRDVAELRRRHREAVDRLQKEAAA